MTAGCMIIISAINADNAVLKQNHEANSTAFKMDSTSSRT